MLVIFVITIILIVFEIFIATASLISQRNIYKKFKRPLTSQIKFSALLEIFHEKFPELKIQLDQGSFIVYYSLDKIVISKKIIHSTTMFDLVYLIYATNLSRIEYKNLVRIKTFQNVIFSLSILFLIASFFLLNIVAVAFVFVLLNYFILIYTLSAFSDLNKLVYRESIKYLDLDEIEQLRIKTLISELKYEFLDYPFEIPTRIIYSLK